MAPVGLLTCFIHRASDGVIQKAVIPLTPQLFFLTRKRLCGLPFQQNIPFSAVISCWKKIGFNILGMPGERLFIYLFIYRRTMIKHPSWDEAYADSGRMS